MADENKDSKEPLDHRSEAMRQFIHGLRTIAPRKPLSRHYHQKTDYNDNTTFVQVTKKAYQICEQHLHDHKGVISTFVMPTEEDYMHHWYNAPAHHWQAALGNHTMHELTWMVRAYSVACTNPLTVNTTIAHAANITEIAVRVKRFRHTWPVTPMTKDMAVYKQMRELYMAMHVFVMSQGIPSLLENGAITAKSTSVIAETKTEAELKEEKDAEAGEKKEGKDKKEDEDVVIEMEEERLDPDVIAEEATKKMHEAMARFDGVAAVTDWPAVGARVFGYVDACLYIRDRWPIREIPSAPDHKATRAVFMGWISEKVQYTMPEAFKVNTTKLACTLALPIGVIDEYTRNPGQATASPETLYKSAYGHGAFIALQKRAHLTATKITFHGAPGPGHLRYARDAVIMQTYHHEFANAINKSDWFSQFFIDNNSLRRRMGDLMKKTDCMRPRRPIVIQMADSYYVHHDGYLWATDGPMTALWYWTYLLGTVFENNLAKGTELKTRWIIPLLHLRKP